MDLLLKVLAVYMFCNFMDPVSTYINNENPKGYIAAVNNVNAFPKNRISSYRKFFRGGSFVNDKSGNKHVVHPSFKAPTSNVFAAIPARQSYVSSMRHTPAPKPQIKDYLQNQKDIHENWKIESVVNTKINQTKLTETLHVKDNLFKSNRNLAAVQQKPSKVQESLLPTRITNNQILQLTKGDQRTKNHKLIPTNTQLLEYANKILHKTSLGERIPYSKSLSRVDTLQKYLDTFPRQGEYKKRDALKSRINGVQYQHQKKKFDFEKYNPNDWELTKKMPIKVKGYEVIDEINKPYAVFDNINKDSFDSPSVLGQDGQGSVQALARKDNKYARKESYIENIFLNPF